MKQSVHENDSADFSLNKDVIKLLLKYIFKYRLKLLLSLFFVFIITITTLAFPFLSRIIIDSIIIKTGYIITSEHLALHNDPDFDKIIKKGISLGADSLFVFQSNLSRIAPAEIQKHTSRGTISKSKFTLIENPDLDSSLQTRVNEAISKSILKSCAHNMYVLEENKGTFFTVSEMIRLRSHDIQKTGYMVMGIIGLFLLQFAAAYFQVITLMQLSQSAMRDLRIDLFSHILSLELSFFDKNPVGKLVSRITNDIESLNELFSTVLVTLIQDILILSGITIMMFITDARLAFIVCASFPFLFAVTFFFRVKARAAYRLIRTKIADLNAFLNENISNIRIIQIFVQELRQFHKFTAINKQVYNAHLYQLIAYAIFRPLIDFFKWFTIGTTIYFSTYFFLQGRISYGIIVMFLAYINNFFDPIGDLAEKFDILQSATAAGEKILSILKAPAKKESVLIRRNNSSLKNRFDGEIIFDDVWFSYVPGEWVLKGVSFSVPARSTLAIVGETGSGKSTIINLLSGLYPIQKGKILIDNQDISTIPPGELRSNIATVMQEVFLFSRTIKDNIVLGSVCDESRFKQVVALTHLNRFLKRLPAAENEPVMERGVTFSAGERQLLAFTRALYFNPSILILDEATSNIDTETETLIQDAIAQLIKGRTSIMIAHRLSTIRSADRILVLNKGMIAEAGDHAALMDLEGRYYDLFRLQFSQA